MKSIVIALSAIILTAYCSSENDFNNGKKQLESMGYTQVENTGHQFWCCGDSDGFSTGFKAKDRFGNAVVGCLCSSIGKGVTIRFE